MAHVRARAIFHVFITRRRSPRPAAVTASATTQTRSLKKPLLDQAVVGEREASGRLLVRAPQITDRHGRASICLRYFRIASRWSLMDRRTAEVPTTKTKTINAPKEIITPATPPDMTLLNIKATAISAPIAKIATIELL